MTFKIVLHMAAWMEKKLSQNRHKGDEDNWRRDSIETLVQRLDQEVQELKDAIGMGDCEPSSTREVWSEAADVANFAMMIADNQQHELGDSYEAVEP